MTGSFSGLNTALSALRYQQVALDVANNNIANVGTDGYVRRRAEAASVGGTEVPARWSTYVGNGDGVRTESVTRLTDGLLDVRVRRERATLSYFSTQSAILSRVESSVGEPGPDGVAAALQALRSGFQDLVSDPAGSAARETVLSKADILASAIKAQARSIDAETGDQRVHAVNNLQQINDAAAQIADLNRSITVAEVNGTDVATLYDKRDLLALDLAKLSGAVTTADANGQYAVTLNGVALVTGDRAGTVQLTGGIDPATAGPAGGPVGFAVAGLGPTPTDVTGPLGGEIGAVQTLLNQTLPNYRAGLDAIAKNVADQLNAQHAAGKDLNGAPGGDFFSYDATDPAGSIAVAVGSPDKIAAALPAAGPYDAGNADLLSRATGVEADYQRLVTGLGTTVAAVNRQAVNQQVLATQVSEQREQMAGVNLDEETVNMLAAQHAYEAASKVMSVLDSVLDTLINRMAAR